MPVHHGAPDGVADGVAAGVAAVDHHRRARRPVVILRLQTKTVSVELASVGVLRNVYQ